MRIAKICTKSSLTGFGSRGKNAYGTDAFDPRWVKEQLGKLVKRLEEPEPRIVDLARLFFTELSTKENVFYSNAVNLASVCIF